MDIQLYVQLKYLQNFCITYEPLKTYEKLKEHLIY